MTRVVLLRRLLAGILILAGCQPVAGQRTYAAHSVLATGAWYKLAVKGPGVYKIDIAFLNKLGINTNSLPSAAIRLFGNGGRMLPESAHGKKTDDLAENALWMADGGDGVFNGADYALFYAPGPDAWLYDSVNRQFHHQKNLYSDKAFYYLSIGGNGLRIATATNPAVPNTTITSFDAHYFYEPDSVNFLNSGKQWFGDEFADMPGKTTHRSYEVPLPGLAGNPVTLITRLLARSVGNGSQFAIRANGDAVGQTDVPAVASSPYDLFARAVESTYTFSPTGPGLTVTMDYSPGSFNAQGWLDWLEVTARCPLSMAGREQLLFRDITSVGAGNIGAFVISGVNAPTQVWEVTDPRVPVNLTATPDGNTLRVVNDCSRLREYVAFSGDFGQPEAIGRVDNQDLHHSSPADLLIVTHPSLLTQAERLAAFHRQTGLPGTVLVTTEQIYNEFSSGTPDPTAIRDFVKMYFDKAGTDTTLRPRYLLLFGDASFDYQERLHQNTNLVPAWESDNSLDPLSTYTSDDFFGFLDDADDINSASLSLLDIGVGRIPASGEKEARAAVDKILTYADPSGEGSWRNELTFVADDEDANLHLQDAEAIIRTLTATSDLFTVNKIYLDAYQQESGSGGSRYPAANLAISNRFFNGTLIWNYTGHGGARRLAEEVVLDQDIINTINNAGKLPLFITATCDFAPYDNPLVPSIGENLLLREKTGAIALMTTTRLVFAYSNRLMNQNYLAAAFRQRADGSYPSLGEALRQAKNTTYTFSGDVINNRKFTLLGDPALTLAFPRYRVQTTTINGQAVTAVPDTLRALSRYTIAGVVADPAGNALPGFNGTLYPTVYDKARSVTTLGNDPGSYPEAFTEQQNILFRGKATVTGGHFSYTFIVPKDIDYRFGKGRASYYVAGGSTDGNGIFDNIIVGGSGAGLNDTEGPQLQVYLNDDKFVDGGITNERPVLLVKLADSSGINIMGTGIGHDLVATLDDDPEQQFVLNAFYEAETGNFRKGSLRFQLPAVAEGEHRLTVKAWDVANNSAVATLSFRVVKEENLRLRHVLNYPNPFTTHTTFWFEHNRPGQELQVNIQVYTVSGKLVKSIRRTIFSTGNRSSEVQWDGRDDYGNRLGRGVYIYRLRVRTPDGKAAEQYEKIYLL